MDEKYEPIRPLAPPLDRIEVGWDRWLATLARVPAGRISEPGVVGDWSAKDIAGHIAFWDEYAIVRANELLAGTERQQIDWQGMNDADIAASADRTPEEQRERMLTAHAALLDYLTELTLDDATCRALYDRIKVDTDEHYAEHAADLAAWLDRAGG